MKIGIIIPYFGRLPESINSFIYSASYNKEINWLIFTDQFTNDLLQVENVKFIKSTFKEIKNRINSVVNKKVVLDAPYKLCDYRPLYGEAFADYLYGYDYWGYGDVDVICGDLIKFILPGLKNHYDRIGNLGHFCLYRNDPEVNKRYLLSIKDDNGNDVRLFERVSNHSRGYAFDELGMQNIYRYYHFSTYTSNDLVNETKTGCLDLYSIDSRFLNYKGVFIWNRGKCLYYYLNPSSGQLNFHEFGYFHFIKRHNFTKFLNNVGNISSFAVTTDGYHEIADLSNNNIEKMMKLNHSTYEKRLIYWLNSYFFSGDITFRKILGIHLPFFELYREIRNHTFRI